MTRAVLARELSLRADKVHHAARIYRDGGLCPRRALLLPVRPVLYVRAHRPPQRQPRHVRPALPHAVQPRRAHGRLPHVPQGQLPCRQAARARGRGRRLPQDRGQDEAPRVHRDSHEDIFQGAQGAPPALGRGDGDAEKAFSRQGFTQGYFNGDKKDMFGRREEPDKDTEKLFTLLPARAIPRASCAASLCISTPWPKRGCRSRPSPLTMTATVPRPWAACLRKHAGRVLAAVYYRADVQNRRHAI